MSPLHLPSVVSNPGTERRFFPLLPHLRTSSQKASATSWLELDTLRWKLPNPCLRLRSSHFVFQRLLVRLFLQAATPLPPPTSRTNKLLANATESSDKKMLASKGKKWSVCFYRNRGGFTHGGA